LSRRPQSVTSDDGPEVFGYVEEGTAHSQTRGDADSECHHLRGCGKSRRQCRDENTPEPRIEAVPAYRIPTESLGLVSWCEGQEDARRRAPQARPQKAGGKRRAGLREAARAGRLCKPAPGKRAGTEIDELAMLTSAAENEAGSGAMD